MKLTNIGVFIAILILIIMLLICHIMNTIYPCITNTNLNNINNNINKKNKIINMFNNVKQNTLPTQYNIITYDNQNIKIPCSNQAQIPCKIQKAQEAQCKKIINPNELSDSELALLYKTVYEMAGNEVLLRTLNKT